MALPWALVTRRPARRLTRQLGRFQGLLLGLFGRVPVLLLISCDPGTSILDADVLRGCAALAGSPVTTACTALVAASRKATGSLPPEADRTCCSRVPRGHRHPRPPQHRPWRRSISSCPESLSRRHKHSSTPHRRRGQERGEYEGGCCPRGEPVPGGRTFIESSAGAPATEPPMAPTRMPETALHNAASCRHSACSR